MTSVEPTVAELGELGIISSVVCPPRHSSTVLGAGDDSAVVTARGDRAVVSTDILVEGEHFRLDWSDPHSIGRRAIAQNAADIEAMGAHPTGYVVAIAAPRDTPAHIITGIGQGTVAEAHRSGADVVGGDFSSAQQIVICVTALGQIIEPVHAPVTLSPLPALWDGPQRGLIFSPVPSAPKRSSSTTLSSNTPAISTAVHVLPTATVLVPPQTGRQR